MSKKEILKPFDIEKAKNGAKIRDRKGRNVRVICFDALNLVWGIPYPIVAKIEEEKGKERTQLFQASGTSEQPFDNDTLFIVEEVEEPDRWIDTDKGGVEGWSLTDTGQIVHSFACKDSICWATIFAKKKMASSAKAAAMISQIIANDKRFGGAITDEEWNDIGCCKFIIIRGKVGIVKSKTTLDFTFLAFHTREQRNLFLKENEDLIRQFYML